MKAALIPPIAHLEEFCAKDDLHLLLAHLLSDGKYYKFYREQRLKGAYLILDNGAHEHSAGEAMRTLLPKALAIRASEVVLPDTLFNWKATVAGAEDALSYLCADGQIIWGITPYPVFMVVPQGQEPQEWHNCFNDLVDVLAHAALKRKDLFRKNFTVGISKDYETWAGGIPALLRYIAPFREWLPFDVHLLGWGRELEMLPAIESEFPWVRSTDSAKPFVYALSGIDLSKGTQEYPGRSPDYFQTRLTEGQLVIARKNVELFKDAANA